MAGWHLSLPIHSWTLHCKPTLLWIFRNTASRSSHFTGNDWKETGQPSVLLSLRRVIRTKNKKEETEWPRVLVGRQTPDSFSGMKMA